MAKQIEIVDQVMMKPTPQSQEMTFRQGFLSSLNTISMQGKDPYESVKVVALSTRLINEGPDWVVENSDFELLKKAAEQNNVGFVGLIQGQLLEKLQKSVEITLQKQEKK